MLLDSFLSRSTDTLPTANLCSQQNEDHGVHTAFQTFIASCNNTIGSTTSEYWSRISYHILCRNVRPWKYYTLGQIPNFLIAAPTATICIAICIYYIRIDLRRFLTLGLSKGGQSRAGQYSSFIVKDLLVPHFILMLFMLVYTSVLVHVQIIARLFSFQPLLYWALAHFYLRGSLRTRKMLACYVLGYASIGSILFVNFYPPA